MSKASRKDESAGDATSDARQVTGEVTAHRVCATCGYDLHGQAVRLDPSTNRRTVRCPECGNEQDSYTLDPALAEFTERAWIVLAFVAATIFMMFQVEAFATAHHALRGPPSFQQFPEIGHLLRWTVSLAAVFGFGIVLQTLARIAFPHWSLWKRLVLVVLWPLAWWMYESFSTGYNLSLSSFLRYWSYRYMHHPTSMALLQMAGMLLGVWLSRWLVRPIRRLLLPGLTSPSRRQS